MSKSEAQAFLELIFAGKPENLSVRLWISSRNQSWWFTDIDVVAEFAESEAAQDICVGLGLGGGDYCATEGGASVELRGLAGVAVEINLRFDAHPQVARPQTAEQALSILPPERPPTCVVTTGGSLQACWLFQEPFVFENDEERKQAVGLAQRWNTLVRDSGRMRGWAIDNAAGMDHLLRVPGTRNSTDPDSPKAVTIHSRTDRRYSPSELIEYLDDQEVPDPGAEVDAKREWGERFRAKPLAINLAARIPDDLLNQWLAADAVFKSTWFRQRSDLPDQSQYEYDLALARYGVKANIEAQRIVDLIVHHRATYKHKPRTRLDYYYRTLAKAANQDSAERCPLATAGPARESKPHDPQPEAPGTTAGPAPPSNPDRAKIALCDELSETFGVQILRIVKISGAEPAYRIELPEGKVHFDSIANFISPKAVQCGIAARSGKLIPKSGKLWQQHAQLMLDACIEEDGGAELELEGAARIIVTQYLAESTFITTLEKQVPQDLLKPMVWRGRITIHSFDLTAFINKSGAEKVSAKEVAIKLSAIGASSIRVRPKLKEFKEQSRWTLPLEDFPPANYAPAEGGTNQNG